ncbi:MAG: hypothetical protein A3J93_05075 [Candidatus Magasanikbacteria bacterium RIFOXYC2_FULL_42_28]|uniref:Uncharacterized protein n=1 Tax=Candidatus Magasanikbacteria bacterium RIFOXYC2_FULL_42_28 TaxID=1798704 RepID=A0A1F6NV34_9BACT|nr:MAG: hypothetical protein A3J93_05075 [Candidatus Magasanikbacteria bacterium RIFOXYC2_FULL_42_28]
MPIPQLRPRKTRTYGILGDSPRRNFSFLKKFRFPRFWQRREGSRGWLKKLIKPAIALLALGIISITAMVAWVSRDLPDPNNLSGRQIAQSTKIYDRTGEHLLYEIYQNQKRTTVELNQISPWVAKATVAVEDRLFYEHSGVRIVSIIRAGINNLLGRSAGSGGASTLTQQFIKNAVVGDEHSIFRKIKEAILALRLERKYSKDEIMKMYLNEVPYGSTNYGVESASQSYFKKPASELTLPEAATLAAIVKAPTRYLNNPESLRDRRDLVLRLMFDQGMITENEKTEAQDSALRLYRNIGIMEAPHFVLYVKQLLAEQFGESLVDTGGLKIITTLDYDKQISAQNIIKEQGDKFAKDSNANNAALVSIDPKTGEILAMVGSRDFANEEIDGQFNVAILGRRQPGSSFKPFVYLAAFEKGYTPETVLYDTITNFEQRANGDDYIPKNYDGKEHGLLTMRTALQGSLNIPAVKTLYLVGQEKVIDIAKRFGYTTLTADKVKNAGLSLVLGGAELNLLEHTAAFATLANNGVYHKPTSILKVTNPQEETLFEKKENVGVEATTPELAALVSNVLSDNNARAYIFGLNNNLVLPDRPVATKTGTTNDNKDAWTMGYTPALATGVWVGNTIPTPMKAGGNTLAGTIWNKFMRTSTTNMPVENFPEAPTSTATKPILRGASGGIILKINSVNGKIAVSTTPEHLIVEKKYLLPHDILHYVIKDDPAGPIPMSPADDPQYSRWEDGLRAWIEKSVAAGEQLTLEEPPSELDNNQSPELAPIVKIITPINGQIITNRELYLEATASAPRGISRVTFLIDGAPAGTVNAPPFVVNYQAKILENGQHVLRAYAEDDMGNSAVAEQLFVLDAPQGPPEFVWAENDNLKLEATDFPRALKIKVYRWNEVKDLRIFLYSAGPTKYIYNFKPNEDKAENGQLNFEWNTYPGAGNYQIKGVLTGSDGQTTEQTLAVTVE